MELENDESQELSNLLKSALPVTSNFDISKPVQNCSDEELLKLCELLKSCDISEIVQSLIFENIAQYLGTAVAPEFWNYFELKENEVDGFKQFCNAVGILYNHYMNLSNIVTKLDYIRKRNKISKPIYNENCPFNALKIILRATLFAQLPVDHDFIIRSFFEIALKMEDFDDTSTSDGKCLICEEDTTCNCSYQFLITNRKLNELGLLEPLASQTLTSLIYNYIYSHIQTVCKDSFDTSYIDSLEKWLENVVLNWLKKIYSTDTNQHSIENFDKKLKNYFYNIYTRIRIDQLFNIIIEYPESLPALEDIRICLPKTDLKPHLIKKLQKAMETRLLHPGVSTPDVLTAYVAAIRSLRVLDPTGLLLEIVTQPVHQYLRSREDTVRCVVSSLTEEGPNDLADELVRGEAVKIDENMYPDDDDDEHWESWVPDPVDPQPSKLPASKRTSDIISMLVNVYGSKELFVNEYRTLLADRLLSHYSCDTEKEIRYLELLKLRFGDSQLHYCEVMLKDIVDSKRINQNIRQDGEYNKDGVPMNAMIVSAQFWPPFKEEKLELHENLVQQMKSFTASFETLKGSRTLCWKNHLGVVDLEIELEGRTLNLSVSPVHATIMMHFQDKNTWTLEELSKKMLVPPTILRRKIGFWQSHGLIVETEADVFLLDEHKNKDNAIQEDLLEDYESESAMASAQDQREEELQTIWSYIVGMLMNLDTLPIERIHQMLKMFAFQGPTIECSLPELKSFLDRKVREHQIIYNNGLYRLPK